MEGLLDEQRNLVDQWETDYIKLERKLKLQPWVYGISAIGYTVGGTFIGMGAVGALDPQSTFSKNMTQNFVIGGCVVGGVTAVYIIGHGIFGWW